MLLSCPKSRGLKLLASALVGSWSIDRQLKFSRPQRSRHCHRPTLDSGLRNCGLLKFYHKMPNPLLWFNTLLWFAMMDKDVGGQRLGRATDGDGQRFL